MKRYVLGVALAILLAGCAGTPFKWDNFRQLKEGMTTQEVEAIMGRPYMVKVANGETTWVWSYANGMTGGSRFVSVVFAADGKMFKPTDIPPSFKD